MEGTYFEIRIDDLGKKLLKDTEGREKVLAELDSDPEVERIADDAYDGVFHCKKLSIFTAFCERRAKSNRWRIGIFYYVDGKLNQTYAAKPDPRELYPYTLDDKMERGFYYEMKVYDRKDFYTIKDPEIKKLIAALEADKNVVRVGSGIYRCRDASLYSYARIYENRRWRMEVVEKCNGERVVRSEPPAEVTTSPFFVKIENRNVATYVWDLLMSFFTVKTMYIYCYIPILFGLSLFILGNLMINESGDILLAMFGFLAFLAGLVIFPFATLFFAAMALYMPFKIYIHYKNKERIEFGIMF